MTNGAEKELVFSQSLTKDERDFLQEQAKNLQLKFYLKPLPNGDSICAVSKCTMWSTFWRTQVNLSLFPLYHLGIFVFTSLHKYLFLFSLFFTFWSIQFCLFHVPIVLSFVLSQFTFSFYSNKLSVNQVAIQIISSSFKYIILSGRSQTWLLQIRLPQNRFFWRSLQITQSATNKSNILQKLIIRCVLVGSMLSGCRRLDTSMIATMKN